MQVVVDRLPPVRYYVPYEEPEEPADDPDSPRSPSGVRERSSYRGRAGHPSCKAPQHLPRRRRRRRSICSMAPPPATTWTRQHHQRLQTTNKNNKRTKKKKKKRNAITKASRSYARQCKEFAMHALRHYNGDPGNNVKYELVEATESDYIMGGRCNYAHVNFTARAIGAGAGLLHEPWPFFAERCACRPESRPAWSPWTCRSKASPMNPLMYTRPGVPDMDHYRGGHSPSWWL